MPANCTSDLTSPAVEASVRQKVVTLELPLPTIINEIQRLTGDVSLAASEVREHEGREHLPELMGRAEALTEYLWLVESHALRGGINWGDAYHYLHALPVLVLALYQEPSLESVAETEGWRWCVGLAEDAARAFAEWTKHPALREVAHV